jgi:hypothetical protein
MAARLESWLLGIAIVVRMGGPAFLGEDKDDREAGTESEYQRWTKASQDKVDRTLIGIPSQ